MQRTPFLRLFLIVALGLGFVAVAASEARAQLLLQRPGWDRSLVSVEVTYKVYDAFQPWNEPTRAIRKHGVVIAPGEILTTAQYLPTHTLVRVQKGGRGRWYDARVKWWDAQSNLAVLEAAAPAFWDGLAPAKLAEKVGRGPEFELLRWRDGNLENRRVEFGKFTVSEGVLGFAPHVQLEVSTDLSGLGWTEVLARDGVIVGLTTYSNGRVCGALPAPFIRDVLAAWRAGSFSGLGYFDFTWQPGSNPELLKELGMEGESRGAVVHAAGRESDPAKSPRPRDILLEIDGFPIDSEGDYLDPDYGHLMLEYLANRGHFAGATVKLKVRRGARELTLDYVVPKADFTDETMPREVFDGPPKYLVAGGLVFQPLTQPFLRGWGDEWRKYAPYRLQYYQYGEPRDKRRSLVVLTGVLPDPINLGYQDAVMLVVDKVNGRVVATLADLAEALETPAEGGVHRVEFMPGRNLQRLVLDAATLDAATARVKEYYGLPATRRL
jgi:Trypsin-like serine proteases, typically periplasmic, contain C-terminal PDZ domain